MKKSSIIGIVLIAIAIAVIVSTYSNSSTYGSFSDARDTEDEIHVVGYLNKQHAMEYNPQKNANLFAFYMIDKNKETQQVLFTGAKPPDFERSEQIVVTGKMEGAHFKASKILMKCPSKYNKDKVETSASTPSFKN